MDKNEIIQILHDWNFWTQQPKTGLKRGFYLDRLNALSSSAFASSITGPRRAGKSIIMRQFARHLIEEGVEARNVLHVNFEDSRFTGSGVAFLEEIFRAYEEFLAPTALPTIFLDEIQEIDGWEKWVRTMLELGKARILVSGSNAGLLSQELGTLLTGRHLDVTVFPLSFGEFLEFNRAPSSPLEAAGTGQVTAIKGLLRKYLEWGAYPEVVLSEPKKEILLSYFEDVLQKDLIRRFKIRKPQELRALAKFYFSSVASPVTYQSAGRALDLSMTAVQRYSGYLEQVYLVFLLKRFSWKAKEQEKSPRKAYAVDTGLCNAVGFRFTENLGRLAENLVFLALKRRQAVNPEQEIYYWKDQDQSEVDFVIKEGLKVSQLLQVCWNVRDEKTRTRDTRSLWRAMREFDLASATIVTEETTAEETEEGRTIRFVPLAQWLLGAG